MRTIRFVVAATVIGISVAGLGGVASATEGDDNNCAGAFVSGTAQALGGGFGTAVSGAAHAQVVDNVGIANCGDTSRQNP